MAYLSQINKGCCQAITTRKSQWQRRKRKNELWNYTSSGFVHQCLEHIPLHRQLRLEPRPIHLEHHIYHQCIGPCSASENRKEIVNGNVPLAFGSENVQKHERYKPTRTDMRQGTRAKEMRLILQTNQDCLPVLQSIQHLPSNQWPSPCSTNSSSSSNSKCYAHRERMQWCCGYRAGEDIEASALAYDLTRAVQCTSDFANGLDETIRQIWSAWELNLLGCALWTGP